jgi:aminoglycoside N3'-acetyltransferase
VDGSTDENLVASDRTASISAGLTQQEFERGLRSLGLKRGDVVKVHSSLSSLGWFHSGASTAVDALTNVVTHQGTILMAASVLRSIYENALRTDPYPLFGVVLNARDGCS